MSSERGRERPRLRDGERPGRSWLPPLSGDRVRGRARVSRPTVPSADPRPAADPNEQPMPADISPRRLVELPAFWVTLALVVVGASQLVKLFAEAFGEFPLASSVAFVLFAAYAVPFVVVVRSFDFLEREPTSLVVTAAVWGATVALTAAIAGNGAVRDLLAKLVSPAFAGEWGPAISAPLVEEILKTLGVVVVVLIARKQINSVVDGAVYGAFVGLGFQIVEDFIYAVNAVAIADRGDSVGPVVVTFFLRGFIAGIWSHTLFSALAGAGVAYFVVRRNLSLQRRLAVAILAVLGAMLFHFVWNSPWLDSGFGYGGFGVLAAVLVKGLPALAVIALLVSLARGREADSYLGGLAALADPNIATSREIAILRTGPKRAAARRYAYARTGRPGRNAVLGLQRAQARLAVDIAKGGDHFHIYRDDVLAIRQKLIAFGHPEAVTAPDHRRNPWGIVVTASLSVVIAAVVVFAINALGGR
jgi:protease PrsW